MNKGNVVGICLVSPKYRLGLTSLTSVYGTDRTNCSWATL